MKWIVSEPITTQSRVTVYRANIRGTVDVRWNEFGHPVLFGPVYKERARFDEHGNAWPIGIEVLDKHPTF